MCMAASAAYAQMDGYQITARTQGLADTTAYLIRCNTDTIGRTEMKNGMIVFKGKTEKPDVAYIRFAGKKSVIPLILENVNIQILANSQGVTIVGGEQQELYNHYANLNQVTKAEQNRVQNEMRAAMQEGNQMKMKGLQNDFLKYVEKMRKVEVATFDSLVNTIAGMYVLSSNMMDMGRTMLRERYDRFSPEYQESPLGKAVAEYLEKIEQIMEGKIAPDFSLPNVEGDTISLHKMRGKVKLVDFWASWCAPCRKEMPNLVKLYKHYQTKGLEILGVSIDDKADAWKKACFEEGITWKSVRTPEGSKSPILQQYMIQSIPFTILLDADNRIVAVNLRGKALEDKIAEMLK